MSIQSSIITACLLLLTGCAVHEGAATEAVDPDLTPASVALIAPPAPVTHTYEVDIDPSFSAAQVETILTAIELVNTRIGRVGLVPVMVALPAPADWHIRVSLMTAEESLALDGPNTAGLPQVVGWTGGWGLACEVKLLAKAPIISTAHEIGGHCFDIDHSDIPANYMNEVGTVYDQVNITDEQVALMIGRLDGKR
jgi:hypothetical protein